MAEASPQDGTSTLSTADAVNLLLAENTPPEAEKAEKVAVSQEPEPEQEIVTDPVDEAEADEVEVEAEEVEANAEEVETDEPEAEEETEADNEVVEHVEKTFRVRLGDEEIDVTQEELVNSYMRQADYTRKTQTLAEQRKALETELGNVQSQRQSYDNQLQVLEQTLSQSEPTQQHWDQLYQDDPLEYTRQRDLQRDRKEALEQVHAERQRVHQETLAQIEEAKRQNLIKAHEQLPELIPEWLDQKVAEKEKAEVVKYAQRQGYSDDELKNVSDPRAISMIRKAYLYDELMSKKPVAQKKAKKAPKMTKSGQPKTSKQSSQRRKQSALANISKQRGRAAMDAGVDYLLT